MRNRSLKTVVMLCAILVTIVLTASTAALAETPGGWNASKPCYSFLNASRAKVFNKATNELVGVSYQPVALLAKQTVAGTRYVYLCHGKTTTAKTTRAWYILTAEKSLKNKVSLRSVKKMELGNIKTSQHPRSSTMDGGLEIVKIKNTPAALPKSARKAFRKGVETFVGYEFRPIALLGTQIAAGKNYKFLCYGTGFAGSDLFVMDVNKDVKGKCRVISCRALKLEKYVG